jgi:hypothetical protein
MQMTQIQLCFAIPSPMMKQLVLVLIPESLELLLIGGLNSLFIKSLANSIAACLVEYEKSS